MVQEIPDMPSVMSHCEAKRRRASEHAAGLQTSACRSTITESIPCPPFLSRTHITECWRPVGKRTFMRSLKTVSRVGVLQKAVLTSLNVIFTNYTEYIEISHILIHLSTFWTRNTRIICSVSLGTLSWRKSWSSWELLRHKRTKPAAFCLHPKITFSLIDNIFKWIIAPGTMIRCIRNSKIRLCSR